MLVAAAIKKDGVIYTGKRHCNILSNAKPFGYLKDGEQGFVTDKGEFLNRKQSYMYAIRNKQPFIRKITGGVLTSEDLW